MKTTSSEQNDGYGLQPRDSSVRSPAMQGATGQTISPETRERLQVIDDQLFEFRQHIGEVFSFVDLLTSKFNREWGRLRAWQKRETPLTHVKLVSTNGVAVARISDGVRAAERPCPDHLKAGIAALEKLTDDGMVIEFAEPSGAYLSKDNRMKRIEPELLGILRPELIKLR